MESLKRVQIEKTVYGGDGLARVEGKVVFVPFAAPGDDLLVSIKDTKRDYLTGTIKVIENPGEGRRAPRCPYYEACGGCQLQHLEYRRQVSVKKKILREILGRELAGFFIPELEFISGNEFSYRRNARFQVGDPKQPILGFYRAKSRDVVDVEFCSLLSDPLNEALGRLRASSLLADYRLKEVAGVRAVYSQDEQGILFAVLARGKPRGEEPQSLAYYWDNTNRIEARLPVDIHEEPGVFDVVAGYRFKIHPLSFFQSNIFLTEKLIRSVLDVALGCERRDLAVELFSGCGLFTLPLSTRFDRVVAVEQDRRSHMDAVLNASINDIRGVEWKHSRVESWVRQWPHQRPAPDFLLLDPPREGLSKTVSRWVLETRPARIAYVSCSPPTLARDLKRWLTGGEYCLESVIGIDLFPQTFHIEVLATLASTHNLNRKTGGGSGPR